MLTNVLADSLPDLFASNVVFICNSEESSEASTFRWYDPLLQIYC